MAPAPVAPAPKEPPNRPRIVQVPEQGLHSALTPAVVEQMRTIAARSSWRQDDVFAKMGGSSVESRAFLYCFRGDEVLLDRRDDLTPTLEFFRRGNAAGRSPFNRASLAARVGWSLRHGMSGRPPHIVQEVDSIGARYAFVLFGGNDVQARNDRTYATRLFAIVDLLMAKGVIPILGATLPRNDDPKMDYWAQRYNQWARAIAEIRQIPFVDYYSALVDLPRRGLASDGVHPNILLEDNRGFACDFTETGLQWGHNVRNLVTLEALDRFRQALGEGRALDPPAGRLIGKGTPESPYVVSTLPFVDAGISTELPPDRLSGYGCDRRAAPTRAGERVYRLELDREIEVRASALGKRHNGPDTPRLFLLGEKVEPGSCLRGGLPEFRATLAPGVWHIVAEMGTKPGDFTLLIDVEPVEPSLAEIRATRRATSRATSPRATHRATRRGTDRPLPRAAARARPRAAAPVTPD